MLRHIPNLLTFSRLILAVVFFALLSRYQYEKLGDPLLLNIAFIIYVIALVTDFLDGYLARRWNVGSAFGRITDPFVDKILVLGSFIFFAGKNFVVPDTDATVANNANTLTITITGIAPWMVVLILARELLVTTFRGLSESSGKDFGANFGGKLKMTLQSVTILVILAYVNFRDGIHHHGFDRSATLTRNVFIYATIVVTVYSGLSYVRKAAGMFHQSPEHPST